MRTVLVCILALIFVIVIVFPACDKSTDIDTDKPPEDNFLCGDANGDSTVNIYDIEELIGYLFCDGSLDQIAACDFDGLRGINICDIGFLINHLYSSGLSPQCMPDINDTVLPVSLDTIIITNRIVPPGENKWPINITIKASDPFQALSFPFLYNCLSSEIICDSIKSHPVTDYINSSYRGLPFDFNNCRTIDTANAMGILLILEYGELPSLETRYEVSIWFSLTPSADSQMIVIDTTTFPPSNIVIMSRFEYPETIASLPVIIFQE